MPGHDLTRRSFLGRSAALAGLVAVPGLVAACSSSAHSSKKQGGGQTRFTFNLGFLPLGRYAPYYYARDLGLYEDRGLDVALAPSTGTGQSLAVLTAGKASATFAPMEPVYEAVAKHPDLRVVSYAEIYPKVIDTVFYIQGRGIDKPSDLEGKTIAISAGSAIQSEFAVMADAQHFDAGKVKWKVVDSSAKTAALLQHQTDAAITTIFGLPTFEAKVRPGEKIGYFTFSDYGVKGAGSSIVMQQSFVEANREAAQAFIQVSLEGYRRAFADPKAAVEAMARSVSTLDKSVALTEIGLLTKIMSPNAVGGDSGQAGLGRNSAVDMKASYDVAQASSPDAHLTVPYDRFFSDALL